MPSLTLTDQTFAASSGGADSSAFVLGTQEPASTITNCTFNANGSNWGLKMPGNVGSTLSVCRFAGGTERALDMVKGSGITFNNCVFHAGGDRTPVTSRWSLKKTCDIGIKGGATDIAFNNCILTDMLIGDHSLYDNPGVGPVTRAIKLTNCVSPNGKPIILRIYNGELPKLVDTKAIALVYYSWVVKTYFWVAGKWIDSRVAS